MDRRLDLWRQAGRSGTSRTGAVVGGGIVILVVVAFLAVAVVLGVPSDGRKWPGQGFVVVVAVAAVGLVTLVGAVLRRRTADAPVDR